MKITNKIIALMAVPMVLASCGKDDDNDPVVPTHQEIEEKIVGKWKSVTADGVEILTNERFVETYEIGGKGYESACNTHPKTHEITWRNKASFSYTIHDSYVTTEDHIEGIPEWPMQMEKKQQILSIVFIG